MRMQLIEQRQNTISDVVLIILLDIDDVVRKRVIRKDVEVVLGLYVFNTGFQDILVVEKWF